MERTEKYTRDTANQCRHTAGVYRAVLAVVLMLMTSISIGACAKDKDPLSLDEIAEGVLEKVTFEDELAAVDAAMAPSLYAVGDFESARIYRGSGATAEEFAIFEAKDNADAEKINEALLAHIESQRTLYAGYMPKEVNRLDKAILLRSDRYVDLCVTDDENAEGTIKSLLS